MERSNEMSNEIREPSSVAYSSKFLGVIWSMAYVAWREVEGASFVKCTVVQEGELVVVGYECQDYSVMHKFDPKKVSMYDVYVHLKGLAESWKLRGKSPARVDV